MLNVYKTFDTWIQEYLAKGSEAMNNKVYHILDTTLPNKLVTIRDLKNVTFVFLNPIKAPTLDYVEGTYPIPYPVFDNSYLNWQNKSLHPLMLNPLVAIDPFGNLVRYVVFPNERRFILYERAQVLQPHSPIVFSNCQHLYLNTLQLNGTLTPIAKGAFEFYNCEEVTIGNSAVKWAFWNAFQFVNTNGIHIYNSRFEHNFVNPVQVNRSRKVKLFNNVWVNNSTLWRDVNDSGFGACGIKVFETSQVTLVKNFFRDHFGHGFWADWNCKDIRLMDNVFVKSPTVIEGSLDEQQWVAKIISNVYLGGGRQIFIQSSKDVAIDSNYIEGYVDIEHRGVKQNGIEYYPERIEITYNQVSQLPFIRTIYKDNVYVGRNVANGVVDSEEKVLLSNVN